MGRRLPNPESSVRIRADFSTLCAVQSSSDSGVTLEARNHPSERQIQSALLGHSDPPPMAPQGVFLWHQQHGYLAQTSPSPPQDQRKAPNRGAQSHAVSRREEPTHLPLAPPEQKALSRHRLARRTRVAHRLSNQSDHCPKTRRLPEAALHAQSFSKNNRYRVTPGLRRAPSALSKSSDHDHHRCTASPTDSPGNDFASVD